MRARLDGSRSRALAVVAVARPQHGDRDDDAREHEQGAAEAAPCQRVEEPVEHLQRRVRVLPPPQQQTAGEHQQARQREPDDVGAGERQRVVVVDWPPVGALPPPPPPPPPPSASLSSVGVVGVGVVRVAVGVTARILLVDEAVAVVVAVVGALRRRSRRRSRSCRRRSLVGLVVVVGVVARGVGRVVVACDSPGRRRR